MLILIPAQQNEVIRSEWLGLFKDPIDNAMTTDASFKYSCEAITPLTVRVDLRFADRAGR